MVYKAHHDKQNSHIMVAPKIAPLVKTTDSNFDKAIGKVGLSRRIFRNLFLEFIGVLIFALYGGAATAPNAPWVNGLILASVIYAGDGLHANPCVTLSAVITRNMSVLVGLLYWIAQIGGAIVGVWWQFALLPTTANHPGCFLPGGGINYAQAFGFETWNTFLFILVVQSVALRYTSFMNITSDLTADPSGHVGPLVVGLTLTGLAFTTGVYTGTSVNFARTLAPALLYRCESAWIVVIYLLAQLLGTVLASIVAALCFGVGKADMLPSYYALFENSSDDKEAPRTVQMSNSVRQRLTPPSNTMETMI